MDEDRRIRFLISPFFLYSSLLWWAYVNPQTYKLVASLQPENVKTFLSIITAAGAATLPVGYSIGTLTTLFVRGCFALRNRFSVKESQNHEVWLSEQAYLRILKMVGVQQHDNRGSLLYAAATFDHGLLPENIHNWLVRRWNSFNIASTSAFALFLSLCIVPVRIAYTWSLQPLRGWDHKLWWWVGTNLGMIIALLAIAYFSWNDTMKMLDFQSRRSSFEIVRTERSRAFE